MINGVFPDFCVFILRLSTWQDLEKLNVFGECNFMFLLGFSIVTALSMKTNG